MDVLTEESKCLSPLELSKRTSDIRAVTAENARRRHELCSEPHIKTWY